jgi:hypothetical protein
MAQIFHRSTNTIARVTIFGFVFIVLGLLTFAYLFTKSPYQTDMDVVRDQPVPFSHEHHVAGLGIDCRYCHVSVETDSFAGVPPTHTCMSCHSQIWNDSPMLAPVRESLADNRPIAWNRVHDLGDFVYFHHGIHIQKGVGCVECHGRVDKMPLTWKAQPMTMDWCLDCHEHPEGRLRRPEDIFNMASEPLPVEEGRELMKQNKIPTDRLTNCSVCHR